MSGSPLDRHLILLHDDRTRTDDRWAEERGSLCLSQRFVGYDAGSLVRPRLRGRADTHAGETLWRYSASLVIGANVELKAVRGREAETGAAAAAMLCRCGPPSAGAADIELSSRRPGGGPSACSGIARGILFRAVPKHWRAVAESLGCAAIHADHRRLHPAIAAEIRSARISAARLHG